VQLLQERMRRPDTPPMRTIAPVQLCVRDSTAAPPPC